MATLLTRILAAAMLSALSSAAAHAGDIVVVDPFAPRAELHAHTSYGDVMRMRQVSLIDVPAGESVDLQPGGLHIMLIDLKEPLKQGETFPLTLTFAKAGTMTVQVPVKSPGGRAPTPGRQDGE